MIGALAYLYVGSAHFDEDLRFYEEVLSAKRVWAFDKFGAKVAALRIGKQESGPLVLLASHRPAGETRCLYRVDTLHGLQEALAKAGVKVQGTVEIPPGTCLLAEDMSGNKLGFFEETRPGVMEGAFADPRNPSALHRKS
jgi:hypothetical protein